MSESSAPVAYATQHTETGNPYLIIPSSSPVPIYLTELFETDIPAMITILNIPEITKSLISIPQPYTQANAQWWYDHQQTGKSNLPLQALRHTSPTASGPLIGSVSLMPSDSGASEEAKRSGQIPEIGRPALTKGDHEVGYYLHPDWQGKGIVRNAVRGLIEWGKRDEGVEKIVISALEGNKASRRVIEGMGGWKRVEEEEVIVDWPESKGGGKRVMLNWRLS